MEKTILHRAVVPSLLLAAWLLGGLLAFALAMGLALDSALLNDLLGPLRYHVSSDQARYSPLAYFLALSLVFGLERWMPARDPVPLREWLFDFCWYLVGMASRVLYLGAYIALLASFYREHLSFLTISAVADWDPLWRFLLGVLVADFLSWASHLIRHKVPLFWQFHAVHHSQEHLNFFTDARSHPIDRTISATLRFIPLLMLGNNIPVILLLEAVRTVFPKVYHGNIRSNFGLIGYIFVSPQFHRVHHAVGDEFQDRNFGLIFSFWDRLFGTAYPDSDVYPATGINDREFPLENVHSTMQLPLALIRQLIYPIVRGFQLLMPGSRL